MFEFWKDSLEIFLSSPSFILRPLLKQTANLGCLAHLGCEQRHDIAINCKIGTQAFNKQREILKSGLLCLFVWGPFSGTRKPLSSWWISLQYGWQLAVACLENQRTTSVSLSPLLTLSKHSLWFIISSVSQFGWPLDKDLENGSTASCVNVGGEMGEYWHQANGRRQKR